MGQKGICLLMPQKLNFSTCQLETIYQTPIPYPLTTLSCCHLLTKHSQYVCNSKCQLEILFPLPKSYFSKLGVLYHLHFFSLQILFALVRSCTSCLWRFHAHNPSDLSGVINFYPHQHFVSLPHISTHTPVAQ